ncbi:acyl-CoA dehydrogenase family protein [Paraburkholderia sp. J67]|uniref:acyl-CoA dehydrogenase family protein n=1 Tax=Paraburkholderia sp. J67 TaxID=2805435 RepID=UPI002ABE5BCC|nr:acyl-CoA dehydrogenase family protein [Paraburkholderia sp. J67]
MSYFDDWRLNSPFYDETHEAIAQSVRRFVEREVMNDIEAWESAHEVPRAVIRKAAQAGLLGLGFPEEYGGSSEGVDVFHKFVQTEELARPGYGGFPTALITHAAGLPIILAAGPEEMKRRVVPQILAGEKLLAFCITEPSGGSDVARITTRARRVGERYVVNGSKTYISHGMTADYYVVAVRTGGEGLDGLSVLLIERDAPGFTQTPLKKMGWHINDTASIYFDNVEVPVENRIGPENGGFAKLMANLNLERLHAAHHCCAFARVALEEAANWARDRMTFGKRLVDHQVIRTKLADMKRRIDATQALVDLAGWRAKENRLGGADLALLKVQATQMMERVARDAAHVLGGASYIEGTKTERIFRETLVMAIGGGSESILLDMAGRHLFSKG